MLKKLRLKLVAVVMLIVTVMLCALFVTVYSSTKAHLEAQSVGLMRAAAARPPKPRPPDAPPGEVRLPYFVLRTGHTGELLETEGGFFDLSDPDSLRELTAAALAGERQTGVLREQRFRYYRQQTPEGYCLVFADISSELSTLRSLALTCISSGALCFFVFLGISLLLARWAVRPVDAAWQRQKQFVADASHELKTPLTVILTNAELLQSPEFDAESRVRFSGSILTMARQMRELVERLLELARADGGGARFLPLDLTALVSNALLPFEPLLYERGLTLTSQIEPGIAVRGSEEGLRQVVDILLDNARKYAAAPGDVMVTLRKTGKRHCCLSVASPGDALSAEERKRIFERFYRADKARSRDGGFGLGLAIAESTVTAHHGRVWAESAAGVNTFFAELPLQQ